MARILVTEKIAESGLDTLRRAGHDVDVREGLSPEDLLEAVPGAAALIIRSATKVTAAVLEAASDLTVVGRAGTGVDNVDVAAATKQGVMVVNAPGANSVSMAEHTMAMLLAQARNIPQANTALKAGKWERTRWEGVELQGKTLGVLGLGATGSLVAQRAHSFGMRLLAWDPWLAPERARQMGVGLVDIETVFAEADFVTVHVKKTADTTGLIGHDLLAKAKPGMRVVNCARGGIIDEDALFEALRDGRIAGAALDVFAVEPTTESPLFELDEIVVTPHLAASTAEAQDKAGVIIAEQVEYALAGEFVPFAVNVSAAEAAETVRPFVPLAERLGQLFASLNETAPPVLDIEYHGQIADYDTRILTLSVLKGFFTGVSEEPVTYVNAPQMAEGRGVEVRETKTAATHDYVNLITLRTKEHDIAGTLAGVRGEPRIVGLDSHTVEVPPARQMLVARNDDRPGMIGAVTSRLGAAGVNISNMHLGVSAKGERALMVLAVDDAPPAELLEELRAVDGIHSVHVLSS